MIQPANIENEDGSFVLRLETNPEKPIPFTMFGDLLIAHQRVVDFAVRSNSKDATIPELEVVSIREGSIEIRGVIHTLQIMAPFVKTFWGNIKEIIGNTFAGEESISVSESRERKVKLSKGLSKMLSDPIAGGYVQSMVAEVAGKELYRLDESNITPYVQVEDPALIEDNEPFLEEMGEPVPLSGKLIEMNWKTHRGKIKADINGRDKQYECIVRDQDFIKTAKIGSETWIKADATPEFKINALGEREVKLLHLDKVQITP